MIQVDEAKLKELGDALDTCATLAHALSAPIVAAQKSAPVAPAPAPAAPASTEGKFSDDPTGARAKKKAQVAANAKAAADAAAAVKKPKGK